MRLKAYLGLLAVLCLGLVTLKSGLGAGLQRAAQSFNQYLMAAPPKKAGSLPTPAVYHEGVGLPVPMILGYYADPKGSVAALKHYQKVLTGLVPFWYTVAPDGTIEGSANQNVLTYAEQHHLWLFALVQNMNGAQVYHTLLENPVYSRRAIDNLLALTERDGYDGVNIDFEGIAPSDRQRFTAWIQNLAATFHRHGYYVTVSVPAEVADAPTDSWTGAYNYAALGKAADLLMIMAYDQHSRLTSAGPIASQKWVENVVSYAVSVVPPKKLILGIPAYGYVWSSDKQAASGITYSQWQQILKAHGKTGNTDHLSYMQNGVLHQVYYESAKLWTADVRLAAGFNLRGIVLWRLGIEDPSIWQYVHS